MTKVYEQLDLMRGTEVFLNWMPACSLEAMRTGMASVTGEGCNKALLYMDLLDSNPLLLTGNTDTVYASVMLDLERDGRTVIEVPPKCGPSTVNDAFFRFVTDMGTPGPDRGAGGKYLILPPHDDGDLRPPLGGFKEKMAIDGEEYWVSKSTSFVNWFIGRGMLTPDGKPDAAVEMWKSGLKVYPLAQKAAPPPMDFKNGSKLVMNTIHANTYEFFEELDRVIQKEPSTLVEPEVLGLTTAIGIKKGRPFVPDARMKQILTEAAAIGNATARAIAFRPRDDRAWLYPPEKSWYTPFTGGDFQWLIDDGVGGRNFDARTQFFYLATVNTPAMTIKMVGVGSQYGMIATDEHGDYLDGNKSYTLNIPKDPPAKNFWSVVIYDPQTRSELQTGQPYPSKNSLRDKLDFNEDGSLDLVFAPPGAKPQGAGAGNWIETVPGKGWFALLRLYAPLEPWFDKTWRPGQVKLARAP